MKTVKILFSILTVGILVAGLYLGFTLLRQNAQLSSGEQFSLAVTEVILSNPDVDYFTSISATQALNNLYARGIEIKLNNLRRMGNLQSMGKARGELVNASWLPADEPLVARYYIDAEFSSGPAQIYLELMEEGGAWKLMNLYVESPLLAQ